MYLDMSGYSYDTYAIRILIRLGYNSRHKRSIHVRYINIFTRYIVSKYDTSRPSYLVLGYERLGGTGGGLYRCVYHTCIVCICAFCSLNLSHSRYTTIHTWYTHDTVMGKTPPDTWGNNLCFHLFCSHPQILFRNGLKTSMTAQDHIYHIIRAIQNLAKYRLFF